MISCWRCSNPINSKPTGHIALDKICAHCGIKLLVEQISEQEKEDMEKLKPILSKIDASMSFGAYAKAR